MESIVINQETGLLRIGRYTIHPRLTFTEVTTKYPEVNRHVVNLYGVTESNIYLPQMEFLGYQTDIRLSFYNRHISGIGIRNAVKDVTDATYETRLHEMVAWTRHVKNWLSDEFGSPPRIEPPVLLDENRWLSSDEIAHLDYWIYTPIWGEFGYTFHWESSASIHVYFDNPFQISSWDGLRDECRYWMQIDSEGLLQVRRNRPLIETAIDLLSVYYDYMALRALVRSDLGCLVFDLPHWSTKVIVDVRPDRPEKPYRISRHDTVRKAYVTAENLIEALRVFLETEKL